MVLLNLLNFKRMLGKHPHFFRIALLLLGLYLLFQIIHLELVELVLFNLMDEHLDAFERLLKGGKYLVGKYLIL